jgi:hypothetical protein
VLNIYLDRQGLRATCAHCKKPLRFDPGDMGDQTPIVIFLADSYARDQVGPAFLHAGCKDGYVLNPEAQFVHQTLAVFIGRLCRVLGLTISDLMAAESEMSERALQAPPQRGERVLTYDLNTERWYKGMAPTEDDIRQEHDAARAQRDFDLEQTTKPKPVPADPSLDDVPF